MKLSHIGAVALLLASGSAMATGTHRAHKPAKPTTASAKGNGAPIPAAPAESASTPASGQSVMTGTNADMIGNAGDPAGSQRGTISGASTNTPSVGTSANPNGPAVPTPPKQN